MTFLNPAAFWGLFLIAIPIIIHLFNFRKVKKLYFSNVAFLQAVKSQSSSKSTLKKLVVLLLRILAIIALVLAFAQPVSNLRHKDISKSKGFYLDNSLSMGRRAANGNDLLTESILMMPSLLPNRESNLQVAFSSTDFDAYHRPVLNKNLIENLAELVLSNQSVSVDQVQSKLHRIDPSISELIILSDFQKSSFAQLSKVLADSTIQFYLYKLRADNATNLFIDSVILDNPIGLPTKNSIGARVTNSGLEDASGVLLKLFRDGRQLASFTESFPSNNSTWINIELPVNDALSGNYELEIEDNAYTFDNKFHFVIDVFKHPIVYQVFDKKANASIRAVYANKDYFEHQMAEIGQVSVGEMLKADLVVLDHLHEIPAWLVNQLDGFGGSVLVFPGENMNVSGLNALSSSLISMSSDTSQYELSNSSLQHPFFQSVFSQSDEKANMPWVKQKLALIKPQESILKTAMNTTALGRFNENTFVFSSPLTDRFTNFQKHGLFLPLMYKISLASRKSPVLAHGMKDRLVEIENDSMLTTGSVKLNGGGMAVVPSVYSMDNKMFIEIPSVLEKPGFYVLTNKGDTLRTLAFNLSSVESHLAVIADKDLYHLAEGRDNVNLEIVEDVEAFSDRVTSEREGFPLWKYALVLALAFLTIELTLLRLFR